eukprot:1948329-Pyramimonas_sp.AAC.1
MVSLSFRRPHSAAHVFSSFCPAGTGISSPLGTSAYSAGGAQRGAPVSYTHLRAHETGAYL